MPKFAESRTGLSARMPGMSALIETLGGIGLFLFGMAVMTSGLRKLAGERLRLWLAKSTRNPVSGAVTGATVTALIQSSSATTVAAIGFVGAGLMTFTESLGVIFGANIGTTITGWMVALLGFKLKLSQAALPLLFVAALSYLFKQNRKLRGFGKALAGFCLIFLGISFLQQGLAGYEDVIDLSDWRAASFTGRLALVLVGIVLTLITQSSSATVATALTALHAGLLDLPQAAAVIIGADIGTTGTAALATIGGTTASRRTGFAHVIYNLMTGVAAFFFLPVYLAGLDRLWPGMSEDSPEMVAVGFHSLFNALGVVIALPFTKPFGRMIERIFPEKADPLASPFDSKLLEVPSAAVAGLEHGCCQLAGSVMAGSAELLGALAKGDRPPARLAGLLERVRQAVDKGRDFAVQVGEGREEESEIDAAKVFSCLHLIDHVERLSERAEEAMSLPGGIRSETLEKETREVSELMARLADRLIAGEPVGELATEMEAAAADLEVDKPKYRERMISAAVEGDLPGEELDLLLSARRWLRRMAYHAARIAHYSQSIEARSD